MTNLVHRSPSAVRAVWLIFREARLVVQIGYALRFLVGLRFACSASHANFSAVRAALAFVAWICVCVAVYALNGISDETGDRLNRSSRPIASGALDAGTAWNVVQSVFVVGALCAAAVSTWLLVVYAVMAWLGWAYSFGSRPLKNTVPSLVFSGTVLGGLTYLAGWIGGSGGTPGVVPVVCCTGMALWMGLAGTATKDLGDVSGDLLGGRRTLPILVGLARARLIASVGVLVYAAVFCVVVAVLAPAWLYVPVLILIGAVVVAGLCLIKPGETERNAYRAFLLTQHCTNLAMLG